jgi:hypothetical protein
VLPHLRRRDRWSSDAPYRSGTLTELVELLVTWELDDFPAFEFGPRFSGGLSPASAVEEIWRGDFDFALAHCRGGIYTLTMHPEVIGRGHRIAMLECPIVHFLAQSAVTFSTMGDYATRWKASQPVLERAAKHRDRIGDDSIESL